MLRARLLSHTLHPALTRPLLTSAYRPATRMTGVKEVLSKIIPHHHGDRSASNSRSSSPAPGATSPLHKTDTPQSSLHSATEPVHLKYVRALPSSPKLGLSHATIPARMASPRASPR